MKDAVNELGTTLGATAARYCGTLLMKVSGVSLLEKSLARTKPDYRDYMRRTSAFLPRTPKS